MGKNLDFTGFSKKNRSFPGFAEATSDASEGRPGFARATSNALEGHLGFTGALLTLQKVVPDLPRPLLTL